VNEQFILFLMLIVSVINMTTALMILILERANMIGTLKALGGTNRDVQRIFLYYAAIIIGRGLLWGNIIGLGLCLIQKYGQVIRLDEEAYYVSVAPIALNIWTVLFLNIGTLLVTLVVLLIPSLLVARISPVKAIRFK
jgi:lipoprotein-releasing system permease protein